MDDRERVPDESSAYHEAGHAVAASVLGFGVAQVTLRECRTVPKEFRDMFTRPSAEKARHEAVLGLAGVIAQDMFRGEADATARARQSCDAILAGRVKYETEADWQTEDYPKVVLRLRSLLDHDDARTRDAVHAAIDEAVVLLSKRWAAVKLIAAALWSGRVLAGTDVESALAGRVPRRRQRPWRPQRSRRSP